MSSSDITCLELVMRVFVTGASGWIASAVIPELLEEGHEIVGLARSDEAAGKVAALGAEVLRGSLEDLDVLGQGAKAADGVVHLGYNHDFSRIPDAARTDRAAIELFGNALAGTDGPLLIASGVAGLSVDGTPADEHVMADPAAYPRNVNAAATLALAERGVRPIVARFAPTVHGAGDHGFISVLSEVAREKGVSGYVGDGTNRWSAVHRLDAGRLVRFAFDTAPAGTILHAVAEEGVATCDIAEAIGRSLGVPTQSVEADRAAEHFGWIGMFFGMDLPASSGITRRAFDWRPSHPTLLDDLNAGHYAR
jgi:nucleoside-diphosphate-sugar epimerase